MTASVVGVILRTIYNWRRLGAAAGSIWRTDLSQLNLRWLDRLKISRRGLYGESEINEAANRERLAIDCRLLARSSSW